MFPSKANLLERIIKCSSNEDDLILTLFVLALYLLNTFESFFDIALPLLVIITVIPHNLLYIIAA